jgi:two-component system response regulator (stage 0 sporulation protein A)
MYVAGIACDGLEAIEMIKTLMPDIVILDVIMPNLDGIGVLEKLLTLNVQPRPLFIMLSAIGQDIFIKKAISLGAEYYIVKPFDVYMLITRIRQIHSERQKNNTSGLYFSDILQVRTDKSAVPQSIEQSITDILHETGIPTHMSGYHYIREAVVYKVSNGRGFDSVTKVIYPKVAEKFNTTSQKVERAIRKAIDSAWERNGLTHFSALFGYSPALSRGKPTNSEFIALIADKIQVSKGKRA